MRCQSAWLASCADVEQAAYPISGCHGSPAAHHNPRPALDQAGAAQPGAQAPKSSLHGAWQEGGQSWLAVFTGFGGGSEQAKKKKQRSCLAEDSCP